MGGEESNNFIGHAIFPAFHIHNKTKDYTSLKR